MLFEPWFEINKKIKINKKVKIPEYYSNTMCKSNTHKLCTLRKTYVDLKSQI
jgi:hypothetical protein